MKKIDFLTTPPKIFIFGDYANKNFCGGLLVICYIFVMIVIISLYLGDYIIIDKYTINYSFTENSEDNDFLNKKSNYSDPELDFYFDLFSLDTDLNQLNVSGNFQLIDQYNKPIELNKPYKRRPSEIYLKLGYICEDEKCSIGNEDITDFGYFLRMNYS